MADVKVKAIVSAHGPEGNLELAADDVVSVSRAEMIYVIGEVAKAGALTMHDGSSISALQAVSLAGGMLRGAAPQSAKVLRRTDRPGDREEIAVDIKKILAGKEQDMVLRADDILFIPNSRSKTAALRALETALGAGATAILWRGMR